MKTVKLLRNGSFGAKGDVVQMTDEWAKRLIEDKAAEDADEPKSKKVSARRISNKSLSAAG